MPATRVSSKWVGGNLVFFDGNGVPIVTFDGINGVLSLASGKLKVNDVSIGSAVIADVTATAAELNKLSGAGATVASGAQHAHVANLKSDYTTGDLDTEAKIIAAINAANAGINAVLAALQAFKINAVI
jgi:hypothetical protein